MSWLSRWADTHKTQVVLLIEEQGAQKEVSLKRMDTVIISGKLKLFDLFTRTKEKALDCKDPALPSLVDECIQSWTDMTIADGEREAKQQQNFEKLQGCCASDLSALEGNLDQLKAVAGQVKDVDSGLRSEVARLTAEVRVCVCVCVRARSRVYTYAYIPVCTT